MSRAGFWRITPADAPRADLIAARACLHFARYVEPRSSERGEPMKKEKYERQREQKAADNIRKAFERFDDALAIMAEVRGLEEWTPEELERLTKIINDWATTLLRITEKMKRRKSQRVQTEKWAERNMEND